MSDKVCHYCNRPHYGRYKRVNGKIVCDECHAEMRADHEKDQRKERLWLKREKGC